MTAATASTGQARYRVTFVVLAAGISAFALLQSLVLPALTTLQADLHTSQNAVTWVLTAYLLAASVFTPIMGRIGDMFGKKRVFVAVMLALAAGCLLAAVATNIQTMIIARVIQGAGGGVLPLWFGIIRDEFPKAKVSGAVGVIASLTATASGIGIVLAGPIVDSLDYHWLFWIPMMLTVAAAVAAYVFVPESLVRTRGRISWLPAVALAIWLVALLLALSQAPEWGWASPKVIALFVAAAVASTGWVVAELRAKTPLIDMTMMRQPAVWTNNLVALIIGMSMYAVFAFLSEFLQAPVETGYGYGASIIESGLVLLPWTATMTVVGMFAGRIARRIGGKNAVIVGCLIAAVAQAMIAFAHHEKWELYLASAIMGVGLGLAFAAMSSLIVAAVPPEQTGVASGMNANIRTIGGSLGTALMASFVTSNIAADGLPKEIGYTIGFAVLSVTLVGGAVAAAFIPSIDISFDLDDEPPHPQLALLAAGTLVGDKPE